MNNEQIFADKMLNWYDVYHRDLPFRRTKDPYKIWLSEIMAQQTQIATVIPYYQKFTKKIPNFKALANANEDDVFKLWEGLGYYSRARRLIPCARKIMTEHGGEFPRDYTKALALPGVGAYTAGAILSICYNKKIPAVDGNVLRVLTRYWADDSNIAKEKTKKSITKRLTPYMPDRAGDFNQSLIELGAIVCTKLSAKCDKCPVNDSCAAHLMDEVSKYPYKPKKKKSPVYNVSVSAVKNGDRYLVYKKEGDGLLSGYWAFPYEIEGDFDDQYFAKESFNIKDTLKGKEIGSAKHIFSHQVWQMQVLLYSADDIYAFTDKESRWVTLGEMQDLAFTTAMKKIIKVIFASRLEDEDLD